MKRVRTDFAEEIFEDRKNIGKGVRYMNTKTLKKGEIIFRQGDASTCMYDILWGKVGVYANYGAPDEKLLTVLETEQFFGEMGMIEGCPRSATIVAMENGTKVLEITAETFEEYFKTRPAKVLMIMQNMSQRLRGLTKDYLEVCRTVAEEVESEQKGTAKSEWLKEHLKKFAAIGRGTGNNDLLEYSSFERSWL